MKSNLSERLRSLSVDSKMDVLRKTAQITSEHFGIDVVFRGNQAMTDGRTIIVPSLSEEAPDDLVEAIIGYIDHEVGHILDSDFKILALKEMEIKEDPRKMLIFNSVEDVRQEAINSKRYKGVGLNLEFMEEWTLRKIDAKWDAKNPVPPEDIPLFNRFCIVAMARAKMMTGQTYPKEFYEKWAPRFDLKNLVEELEPEISTWESLATTEDAWEAAMKVLKRLDEIKEMEKKSRPEEATGPGSDDEDSVEKEIDEEDLDSDEKDMDGESDDEGDESDRDEEVDESDRDEEDDEASGSMSGGGSSMPGMGEDEEEEGKGDPDDEFEDLSEEEEEEGEEGSGGEDEEEEEEEEEKEEDSSRPDDEEVEDKESLAGEDTLETLSSRKIPLNEDGLHEITQMEIVSGGTDAKGHRAYSTEFDRTIRPTGNGTLEEYNKSFVEARPSVNVIYTVLTRVLMASARSKTQYGRMTGKVNTTAVGQLRSGNPGIFKRKRKGLKLNTYVEIVVDQSGSMSGGYSRSSSKIGLAQQTCIVLAEAMDRIGIPFGICGFTSTYDNFGIDPRHRKRFEAFYDELHSKGENFQRLEPLIEYCYKKGDEPLSKVRPLLSLMRNQHMANNADGDSIMRVAKRVMKRKEERKILIVLSDGFPAADTGYGHSRGSAVHSDYMKRVSKIIKMTPNLEVIGIGINSAAVKEYYEHWCVVNDISELPTVAVTKLKEALIPGMRGLS